LVSRGKKRELNLPKIGMKKKMLAALQRQEKSQKGNIKKSKKSLPKS